MSRRDEFIQVAKTVPFDNSTNGFISDDVQAAIEEVNNKILTNASPGFSFGRSGVCTANTYLQNETVPSNVSGRWVYLNSGFVTDVYITNELTTTYTVDVYHHDGNEVNLTLLGSATVTAAKGAHIPVSWAVPTDKQIAVKISNTTANSPKNVVCGLQLTGAVL